MTSRGAHRHHDSVDQVIPRTVQSMAGLLMAEKRFRAPIPELYISRPTIMDPMVTDTSKEQNETVEQCLPCMANTDKPALRLNDLNIPKLEREKHVKFLRSFIEGRSLPLAFDASRPWIGYWCLASLSLLGEDVEVYRTR